MIAVRRPSVLPPLLAAAVLASAAGPTAGQAPTGGPPRTVRAYRGGAVTLITDLPEDRARRLLASASDAGAVVAKALRTRRPGTVNLVAWDDKSVWPADQLPPTVRQTFAGQFSSYLDAEWESSGVNWTVAGVPVASSARLEKAANWYGGRATGAR